MAQNSRNVQTSAVGPARPAAAELKKRAVLSSSSFPSQSILEQRRRAFRTSTSSEKDQNLYDLNKFSNNYSRSRYFLHRRHDSLTSLSLYHPSKPPSYAKVKRFRQLQQDRQRALALFYLRRLLWRRSRKPTFDMEFIAHLRRLQAEESDSDEESGRILTSSTFPSVRRRCPASKPAPIATVTITSETCGTKAPMFKPSSPTANDKPTLVTNGTNGLKKRARDDDPDTGSPERAAKKVKSSAIPGPMKGGTSASSSAPVLSAPIKHSKPIEQMEYFERRVHDMLTNPLDFDDCVYDSTKSPSRNTVRSFARYRRLQSKSPPPLVMSGALGPVPLAKSAPAAPISRSKGSPGSTLAKKAQRKAHDQKVQKRVEDIRAMEKVKANGTPKAYTNGNTDGKLTDNAVQGNGNGLGRKAKGSGHSMAHKKGKMADVDGAQSKPSGVKKRKEKRWLTNSRGAGGYGGSRPSNSAKKVNKGV